MTFADLKRHCAAEMGLDETSTGVEDVLMGDWANQGVIDVLVETHCRLEVGDQALTPGVADYHTDANVLAVDHRTILANTLPLRIVTIEDIFDMRRATPQSAVDQVTYFASHGDLLMVYPTPNAATTIRYLYVAKPTPMTSGTHDPSNITYGAIPVYGHDTILMYMLWRAARYDDKSVPRTPKDYRDDYDHATRELRVRTHRQKGISLGRARIGYPGGARIARRNDVYPF